MADIQLTVGIDQDQSYNEFTTGINELATKINKSPMQIKVMFDPDSIKEMKAQAHELSKTINKANTSKKFNANSIRRIDISKYTTEINQNTKAKEANAKADSRLAKDAKKRANELSELASIIARLNDLEAEPFKGSDLYSDNELKKYANMLVRIDRLVDELIGKEKKLRGARNSSSAEDYKNIQTELLAAIKLRDLVLDKGVSIDSFEEIFPLLKAFSTDTATAIKIAGNDTAKLTRGTKAYHDSLGSVDKMLRQIAKNKQDWASAANSKDSSVRDAYNEYVDLERQLEDLREAVESGKLSLEGYKNALAEIQATAAKTSKILSGSGDASSIIEKGSTQYLKSIKEIESALAQANKSAADFESAKYGDKKAQGAYSTLLNQITALKKLREELENGTISVEKYNKATARVKARIAESTQILSSTGNYSSIIEEGSTQYHNSLKEIEKESAKIAKNKQDWIFLGNASSNINFKTDSGIDLRKTYNEYVDLERQLEDLREAVELGKLSLEGYKNALAEIQATAAKLSNTISSNLILAVGTEKYAQAEGQAEGLLKRAEDILKSSSKAKWGKSKKDYLAIENAIPEINSLITELQNGAMSEKDFAEKFQALSIKVLESSVKIRQAGENTKSFADRLKGLATKFSSWLTASQIILYAVNSAKAMVRASIEVESAMAQIKIVTGATDTQMESFLSKSIELAKELGQSITDVAASIETFARLGYNMEEAANLSRYANIMANVGNTDIDTATTGITSIIKGYGLNPDDAEHVADVLVKVGQEYAISAEELMAAFQRGGAALHASGTDFEKSAALFAATNASLQNAETTGVMWKTNSLLSLRIEMCA